MAEVKTRLNRIGKWVHIFHAGTSYQGHGGLAIKVLELKLDYLSGKYASTTNFWCPLRHTQVKYHKLKWRQNIMVSFGITL